MNSQGAVFIPAPGTNPPPVSDLGGKGCRLARLVSLANAASRKGGIPTFRVPRFLVVKAGAFERCVVAGRRWPESESEADQRRLEVGTLEIPATLRAEIIAALRSQSLFGVRVAVRSSAAEEDGSTASFAGQFETVLGVLAVDETPLWDALRSVWA
ncbi:MAG: PEP/pyruvate-binding domain-containing protein, partial [Tepidiformaceae bacterium]